MPGFTPLFWRTNYAEIQSNDSFLAGIDFLNDFRIDLDFSQYRTWMVINQNSDGLRSPCRATFGGAFSREIDFLPSDLQNIIFALKTSFPGTHLEILLPPAHLTEFDPAAQLRILSDLGANIDFVERSYYLPLENWSHSNFSKGNRKKYRQWTEANGSIREVGFNHISEVYEIIRLNRLTLGVEPSINLQGLQSLFSNFPAEYSFYLGQIKHENAVAAVVVRNSFQQDYVFFWADNLMFRHFSPVVAMCDFLGQSAREKCLSFLDLGTCIGEGGVDNPSLVRFKTNLGALPSDKYQVSLTL